jgi:HAD superfamily hydrolase (TIGR01484 family)
MNLNAKYLFFDLDDTLTPNKTIMEDDMYELLSSLPHTKVIVSGANIQQISAHTRGLPIYKLAQNGNHAVDSSNGLLWKELFVPEELEAIQTHIDSVIEYLAHSINVKDVMVHNHGGQVSLYLLKRDTDTSTKQVFDPERIIRKEVLEAIPFKHNSVEVTVAGATSFDYLPKGKHKGFYVKKFIDRMGWNKDDCLYFGDSFYPGGNDEPVKGVIETVSVQNHRETYQHLLHFK